MTWLMVVIVREENIQWSAWSDDPSGTGRDEQDGWWHQWM